MAKAAVEDLKDSSAFKSPTWTALSPSWKITRDLWGTALDIRSLGTEYLRQFPKEPNAKYEERRSQSVFDNKFRDSIETMAGMVFRTDPEPDDLDPAFDEILDDIDLCGNSFWAFTLKSFEMFLRDGNGFIYIDSDPLSEEVAEKVAEGVQPTLADRINDRPWWVFYEASQIINYRFQRIGSRLILIQVTIEETVCEPTGTFGEQEIVQHRVLRPGSFEVWRQDDKTKKWTDLHDNGTTGLDFIPLVPLAEFDSVPPMLTLGLLNILHYNQTSDYDDICHIVCTPQQVRKYDSKQDAADAKAIETASPGNGIKMWGEHAEVFYVEVTGTGLERVEARYKDIEQKMAKIGVGMLEPTSVPGIRTATEVLDTAGQRQSKLSGLTRQFENGVEKALFATAQVINAIKPNTINLDPRPVETDNRAADNEGGDPEMADVTMKLKIDYERLTFSLEQLVFFSDLVDTNKLSLDTFLHWLPQVADMPQGFDPDTELAKIRSLSTIVTEKPTIPEPAKLPVPGSEND